MNRKWTIFLATAVFLLIVGVPIGYRAHVSTTYRNFRVVDPGRMYRSGQMSPAGFARQCHEYDIKTVISLRDTRNSAGQHEDDYEETFCKEHNIGFYRIPPADWSTVDGIVPGDANIVKFIDILDDPTTKYPVLVHCFAGIHRTGAHIVSYRLEYNGWSNADAVEELKSIGTPRTTFADDFIHYLSTYIPKRKPVGKSLPAE